MTRPRSRQVLQRLVSIHDAAEYVGRSETVFRAEVLPFLTPVPVGKRKLVDLRQLDRWVDDQLAIASARNAVETRGPRGGRSTGNASRSTRASATERKLTASLERRMRKRSRVADVVSLDEARSTRRSSGNG